MAPEFFRNTGFGDIMEIAGIWQFPSNFKVQQPGQAVGIALNKEIGELEAETIAREQTRERGLEEESDLDSMPEPQGDRSKFESKEVDPFVVDWNGAHDPEHPLNWTNGKRSWQIIQIMLLTSITYAGSSIYTAGQEQFQKDMHIGHVAATLPLSIYVFAYGLGPLIFSPLSEVAVVGRNQIYLITLFFFTIFQIGCALVNNLGGMIVLRFITGILCSPSLSTGGASMGDIVSDKNTPLAIGLWAAGGVAAPAIAPLLGAAMYVAKGWRFIFWFLMMGSGAIFLMMFFCSYETYESNILHRRAVRVRKETGDDRYYTLQERIDSKIEVNVFFKELFLRPFIILFAEQGVMAFNLYISLGYGAFYLFFEAFPIVFVGMYHFTPIELGLAFLGFEVACAIGYILLVIFVFYVIFPSYANNTYTPETYLKLPMMVGWLLPFSLFFFGWTAGIHWIMPVISELFFLVALYNLFQGAFSYLSKSYPRYTASVFASNGFMRACFACSFPLFGQAMFLNTGSKKYPVGWGSSIISFFTIVLAALPFIFYRMGAKLRGKSEYAN